MNAKPRTMLVMMTGLTLLTLSIAGYQAYALNQIVPRPSIVATIDLQRMIAGLDQRAALDEELNQIAQSLSEKADAMAEEIEGLEEEVSVHTAGTQKHQQAMEELQLASLEYQAHAEFARRKLDIQQGLALKRLFVEIQQASRIMAEELGYDLIFVDDSQMPIASGQLIEIEKQVLARKMVYANPEIEITNELIVRMNNAFRVGK